MDFKQLLCNASLTIEKAAQHLGVSEQTIYRYIRHGAPTMAHRALEFRAGINPDYSGLRFQRDGIWIEHRRLIERADLKNIEWMMQREFYRGQAVKVRQK
jgi:transposase